MKSLFNPKIEKDASPAALRLLARASHRKVAGADKQDDLEQHHWRVSGSAGLIAAEALTKARQVKLVIEKVA